MLFTAVVGCRISAFVAMSVIILFGDGLVMGDFLVIFELHCLGMLEFVLHAYVLGTGMWDGPDMFACLVGCFVCFLKY